MNRVSGGNSFASVNFAPNGSWRLYASAIDITNYERILADFASSIFRIWAQCDGTGTGRALQVGSTNVDGDTSPRVYTQWFRTTAPFITHVIGATVTATGIWHELNGNSAAMSAAAGTQTAVGVSPTFAGTVTQKSVAFAINLQGTFGSGGGFIQEWQMGGAVRASIDSTGLFTSVASRQVPVAVAALPAAATVGDGARAMVNNANAPAFGAAVVGGGAVTVPVYTAGGVWMVG